MGILHPEIPFHILAHVRARRWSLHVCGAFLFRRGIRASLRLEMGPGECGRDIDGQGAVSRILHFRSASPVWTLPGHVVGAYEAPSAARRRARAAAER